MVRRASPALRTLLLLVLPALFTGCAFFTSSPFPGYLAQAEVSYDLRARIDQFLGGQDYPWHAEVFVLRSSAGSDYGAVQIGIETLPNKLLVLVDRDGHIQQLSNPGLGRLHLRDANNDFVVGQLRFPPDALAAAVPIGGIPGDNLGFSSAFLNYLLWTDGSITLSFSEIPPGWGGGTNYTAQIDTGGGFELRQVFYDPGVSGREVVLVLFNFQASRPLVLFTPAADYSGGIATPPTLRDQYPHLELEDVDANSVLYTRKGIVIADGGGHATLLDIDGQETSKKLYLGHKKEVRIAFNVEGDTFFAFNSDDRILYRGKTGW